MKNVLIVAYHFPPSNAVGALRPAKFAEYLPEFGWTPTVLAARGEAEGEDERGPAQFPAVAGVRTERVAAWPGLRDAARWLRRFLRSGAAASEAVDGTGESTAWAAGYVSDPARRNRLRDVVYSLMWLPDDRQGWIAPAVLRGLRCIRENRPDVILVTSPPHSAQVVGLALSRLTGVPLVADFRDPWIGNPATPEFIRAGPTPLLHETLQAQVLHRAAVVVTATEDHAARLRLDDAVDGSKLAVIPNGFDARSFPTNGARIDDGPFTVTYTGNFYHTRTPAPLFDALAILGQRGLRPSDIRIRLVGNCRVAGGEAVEDIAARAGFDDSLDFRGRVPHRDALAELVAADLLLLLASDQPEQIPAKAYEYLASGRPMLALTGPGATERLVRTAPNAVVLTTPDPEAIADVLDAAMRRPRERPDRWSVPPWAAPYERRSTAQHLAGLLRASAGGA